MGLFGYFSSRLSFHSSSSLSLGDGPILTEILSQRAFKPKTTNQPIVLWQGWYKAGLNPNKNSTYLFVQLIKLTGVGRFRILGGQGLEYWGGGGGKWGPNSQQAHDVVTTSMRRNDVASSFRRHVPTRFLINQCQIITFLILKSDNIENSRIELKGIVLQVRSNKIKVTFIII